jgi:hypothetical protein
LLVWWPTVADGLSEATRVVPLAEMISFGAGSTLH